ncbi:prepilin-type N-terminal cleavage/methylation domain-containing protein [Aeribacillus sp. FSL M8-0254]|uniref:prepilin-type N-terminal cleavage/methylation domain-containing protein n=1 Tax=Aeribacillus sp. FSL M8-0254 TaxID=2954577 RepID=UPI0030F96E82
MRKHVKLLKKEKGMTLIELLAVIIIIAIILAIAIPIITNVIGDSRDRATVSEALNIISAAKLKYAQVGDPEDGDQEDGDQEDGDQEDGTEASYTADELAGYIDFEIDNDDFRVSFNGTTWSISGHPAVGIAGTNNATSVTEGELRKYLDNN